MMITEQFKTTSDKSESDFRKKICFQFYLNQT